ncbi:hypothetical protein D3C81_1727160 [compost metagenome]
MRHRHSHQGHDRIRRATHRRQSTGSDCRCRPHADTGRAPVVSVHQRARQPVDGRLQAQCACGLQKTSRRCPGSLPQGSRAFGSERRDTLGRRAANGRHRPGPDGRAQAVDVRRTLPGLVTPAGLTGFRDHQQDPGTGHDCADRRAEHRPYPAYRPSRICAGKRRSGAQRHRAGASR